MTPIVRIYRQDQYNLFYYIIGDLEKLLDKIIKKIKYINYTYDIFYAMIVSNMDMWYNIVKYYAVR